MATGKLLGRDLGLFTTTSLGIGALIFLVPALAFEVAGPWVVLAFPLAGLIALTAALSKAELATAMPVSGGPYVFINRSLGPWLGTVAGLGVWGSLILKGAFAMVGVAFYLALFDFAAGWDPALVALVICLGLLILNALGAKISGRFQLVVVIGFLITLAALAIVGLVGLRPQPLPHLDHLSTHGAYGILEATALVFVIYIGLTKIASVGEEVRSPSRNLPLAMGGAVLVMTVVYSLVMVVYVAAVPDPLVAARSHTPIVEMAVGVWDDPWVRLGVASVAVLALVSLSNAAVMTSSRYPFAFGRTGMMPHWFARINPIFGTPINSLLVTGAIMMILIALVDIHKIAELASATAVLLFLGMHAAVVVLRLAKQDWYAPGFRSPFFPIPQLVGGIGCSVLFLAFHWQSQLVALGFLVVGSIWYAFYTRRHSEELGAVRGLWTEPVVEPSGTSSPARRILVPLLDPRDERDLFELAAAIVGPEGEILAADFQVVPQQLPLDLVEIGPAVGGDEERVERKTTGLATPVRFVAVTTHDLDYALVDLADEEGCTDILLDWTPGLRGNLVHRDKMKWVLRHAHVNVVVVKDRDISEVDRVLVYADERLLSGNSGVVLGNILDLTGGRPTFLVKEEEREQGAGPTPTSGLPRTIRDRFGPDVEIRILDGDDVDLDLIAATRGFDLLIMASPQQMVISERMEWKLTEGIFGTHIDNIAHQVEASVILLKDKVDP